MLFNQYNGLSNIICLNPQHKQKEIAFICFNTECNGPSRLVCIYCQSEHENHRLISSETFIEEIRKNIAKESHQAKEALLQYQSFKEKIIDQLDQIEVELISVCQIRMPNEAAEEFLTLFEQPLLNREVFDKLLINYLLTDEQHKKQNPLKNYSTDYLCRFSHQIANYMAQLNLWLAHMPKINFRPQSQQVLQIFQENFGVEFQNKISPEKYLVQQFQVAQPTRLNQLKHGKIQGDGESLIQINFYIGPQLENPFYKYSVKIQEMKVDQRSPNEFISKLNPPLYLYPKMKYCISIKSQDNVKILDFSQILLEGPNQNFSLHPLTQINKKIYSQRYFVTEFIYDIMEIL
ncbi:hypothetical protein pb186bvf_014585 [Paramecium bursaria]